MSHSSYRPSSTMLLTRIIAIILVFAAALSIYPGLRGYLSPLPPPPPTLAELTRFEIHQLDVGTFLQMTIVPIILIYLLTVIPYFRRLLQDQSIPHTTLGVFVGLVAIQLISQTYDIWTCRTLNYPFYIDVLVILIGSLLGGWRIGLSLGAISMLFQGTYELIMRTPTLLDIQALGIVTSARETDWTLFLFTNYLVPHFSAGVWVAVLACLSADALGAHRYSPLAAMGLGVGLPIAAGYMHLAAGEAPSLAGATAQALITGLAAAVVMLMIHNLQVDAARRKSEAAELIRAQAELRALRAQINPHFLFNALNTIRYMIRMDPEVARHLLLNLSEVFQRTLQSGEFVSLRDELSYVEAYLSLEKARLGDRLRIEWGGVLHSDMPLQTETALLDQPVPTLALQPLVENAVIHGIGKKKEGGTVTVAVEHWNDNLVITVEDDGVGMSPTRLLETLEPGENRSCIGLCNVDGRLQLLYGEEHRIVVESEVGRGTRVMIRIPVAKA